MNAATRQKLYDALMVIPYAELPRERLYESALSLLRERINKDLDMIVPVIDKLLLDREEELRKPMVCGHPTACLELAEPSEQFEALVGASFSEAKPIALYDPKKLKYACIACECEKQLVRRLVDHVLPMCICKQIGQGASDEDIRRQIVQAIEGPKPPVRMTP